MSHKLYTEVTVFVIIRWINHWDSSN